MCEVFAVAFIIEKLEVAEMSELSESSPIVSMGWCHQVSHHDENT